MERNAVKMITSGLFALALAFALSAARPAQAQDAKNPYPTSMRPLDQYLMGRDAEIALARSAAPESISRDATILVLGRQGYETAVQGHNGFVCLVDRSWGASFDWPEFWNPKVRSATCFNPPAAHSIIPIMREKTELLLAGRSKTEVIDALKASFAKGELPALEPGAMSYMMGKGSYLTDKGNHDLAHVMFYTSSDAAAWGANLPNSPVRGGLWFYGQQSKNQLKGLPAINIFIVAVRNWSDGTPVN